VSGYSEGVRIERLVIDDLKSNGYDCVRAASSKGAADVVSFKPGQVLLVSVKRTKHPPPAERAALWRLAGYLPGVAVPLVALKPLRRPLTYRELTGTGPRAWRPWTPDQLEEAS
jgi:Holliday junction resolvase